MHTSHTCIRFRRRLIPFLPFPPSTNAIQLITDASQFARIACPDCGIALIFIIAAQWLRLAKSPSDDVIIVRWCSNLDCNAYHGGFSEPYVSRKPLENISTGAPRSRLRVFAPREDRDPDMPVIGSKIGGQPYGSECEVPEYDEFLGGISANEIHNQAFPSHCELYLYQHAGLLGYGLMF